MPRQAAYQVLREVWGDWVPRGVGRMECVECGDTVASIINYSPAFRHDFHFTCLNDGPYFPLDPRDDGRILCGICVEAIWVEPNAVITLTEPANGGVARAFANVGARVAQIVTPWDVGGPDFSTIADPVDILLQAARHTTWRSTSAWRGYMDVSPPDGWVTVLDGTAGLGGLHGEQLQAAVDVLRPNLPLLVWTGRTSNVLAVAVDIMVLQQDHEEAIDVLIKEHVIEEVEHDA